MRAAILADRRRALPLIAALDSSEREPTRTGEFCRPWHRSEVDIPIDTQRVSALGGALQRAHCDWLRFAVEHMRFECGRPTSIPVAGPLVDLS